MEAFKKQLAETVPKETVEAIEKKVKDGASGMEGVPKKMKSSLAPKDPNAPPGAPGEEKKEGAPKKSSSRTKKPKLSEEAKGMVAVPLQGAAYIDLNQIAPKRTTTSISKLAETFDPPELATQVSNAKNFMLSKDVKEGSTTVKRMEDIYPPEAVPLYEKIDSKLEELSKKHNKPVEELIGALNRLSGNFEDLEKHLEGKAAPVWSELEDMALKHLESADMQTWLLKMKGADAVEKRKKFLGLI